ncbi:MAG TPA: hypothetical protein VM511_03730, partial [Luteolibacter sp.]|nr:hypothetical protein [Luteolibacter sp.]
VVAVRRKYFVGRLAPCGYLAPVARQDGSAEMLRGYWVFHADDQPGRFSFLGSSSLHGIKGETHLLPGEKPIPMP